MLFKKKQEIVGVDIGSSSIKLVQLKEAKGGWALTNLGIAPLPAEAIVDNSLMDSSAVVEALKGLVQANGIKAKDAASSISGSSVIIRKISMPTMSVEELEDQIQWEAEQYIPFDINDVYLDFQVLESPSDDAARMNVLLAASKKDIINDYVTVFSEAGFRLAVVDVDAFALQNAFEANYPNETSHLVVLVNIGASVTNLNIVRGGASLFTRDIQIGGNQYTDDLQRQLGLAIEDAERLKLSGQYAVQEQSRAIIDRVNENLAQEIKRSIDFYLSTVDDRVSKIFLSGGGAKVIGLADAIGRRIDVPVELINPFKEVRFSDKEFDAEYLAEVGPLVTVAVGLATRRLGDK